MSTTMRADAIHALARPGEAPAVQPVNQRPVISVIGLGYVGAVSVACFAISA